jgi:hypothetical protein
MIYSPAGKSHAGLQVFGLQIGHLRENLSRAKSGGKKVQYIADTDAHTTNAGPSAALLWVNRDSLEKCSHVLHEIIRTWNKFRASPTHPEWIAQILPDMDHIAIGVFESEESHEAGKPKTAHRPPARQTSGASGEEARVRANLHKNRTTARFRSS